MIDGDKNGPGQQEWKEQGGGRLLAGAVQEGAGPGRSSSTGRWSVVTHAVIYPAHTLAYTAKTGISQAITAFLVFALL